MALNIDFEPIRIAIYDWLNQALNQGDDTVATAIPIIRAEDDSVRPTDGKLFVEFKFLTGLVKIGMSDELIPHPTDPTLGTLIGQRNITASVQAFGKQAPEAMAQAQQSLSDPVSCDILRAAGLAVRGDESIADSSVLLETRFEERAVLDVIFGLVIETDVNTGAIEIVDITSKLPGGKLSTIDKNNGISVSEP